MEPLRMLRQGARGLRRSPGYSLVTIATVCLAIGANTAMFGVLHAVLLRQLPYPEPHRLVEIGPRTPSGPGSVTFPEFERLRDAAPPMAALAVHFQNTGVSRVTLTFGGEPESIKAGFVSASFFPTLGVAPRLGRVFTDEEERQATPVAVISDGLWRRRFNAAQSAIGATVTIDGVGHDVIGVMPPEFIYPDPDNLLWVPLTRNRSWTRRAGPIPFFRVIGRLPPGIRVSQAEARLGVSAAQFRPKLAGNLQTALCLLAGAAGLILLIACVNLANLTLARGSTRQTEVALRVALGAGRARVAAEMFMESLILAAIGAAAGLVSASWAMDLLIRFGPPGLPRLNEAGLDPAVAGFSMAATVLAAVLFGLLPAWKLSGRDAVDAIRSQARGNSGSAAGMRWRTVLVVAEVALSVMLLAGAGLMLRSFSRAAAVPLGFRPEHALTMRILFPDGTPPRQRAEYFRRLFERLDDIPGVTYSGAVDDLFSVGGAGNLGLRAVEGQPPEPPAQWTPLAWATAGGRFFDAMGAQLVRGRWFNTEDHESAPLAAVIDEGVARRYWPGEDPIGKRFKGQDARGRGDEWLTVIGVVRTMRRQGLEREPAAQVFEWYRQSPANALRYLVVRTAADPADLAASVRAVARALDPAPVLSGIQTLEAELDNQQAARRFQTGLLSMFAGIGLLLAIVGVIGVMNYSVAQRTREFGIRAALGESAAQLRGRILRHALGAGAAGVTIGLAGAAALSGILRRLLFEVSPFDPLAIGGASAVLLAAIFAAGLAPAARAGRIEPIEALRQD